MADALPSPPTSRSSTPKETTDKDELVTRLDGLLEQYLELLHQYTTLREELSKTFSSGFFSLAQAQRASTLGAGRRYGEENYDERMKAQRKVLWNAASGGLGSKCVIVRDEETKSTKNKILPLKETATKGDIQSGEEEAEESEQEEHSASEGSEIMKQSVKEKKNKKDPAQRDPLTWFGILVPPALRQTQGHFVKALEDQIPSLVTTESQMDEIEQRIWITRERLGTVSEYEQQRTKVDDDIHEVTGSTVEVEKITNSKDNKSPGRSLTSRPAHSRSNLLKLGS